MGIYSRRSETSVSSTESEAPATSAPGEGLSLLVLFAFHLIDYFAAGLHIHS